LSVPLPLGKRILGAIVIGISAPRLFATGGPAVSPDAKPGTAEVTAGLAAGVLSGWVNMSGPPLVYWAHRRLPAMHARAILASAFVTASFVKLTSLTVAGYWIPSSVLAGAAVVPLALLGTFLGDVLARRTNPKAFARAIWMLFLLLGLLLFLTAPKAAQV